MTARIVRCQNSDAVNVVILIGLVTYLLGDAVIKLITVFGA